jgi:type IV pilus assembly protein PilW
MTTHTITKLRRQRGMTLVELMVAMVLSIFLVGGIIQIFIGNRVTYAFNEGLSRIQENARFSLEHIAFTARMAGYSGCLSDVNVFNNLTTPNAFRDDIANGITGHDANGTGIGESYSAAASDPAPSANVNAWTPALPPELNNRVIPGSDVLIVRGAAGTASSLIAPFSDPSNLYIAPSHDFVNGEILVVADCQKASIFQLTNSGVVGPVASLAHGGGGGFSPGNAAATWPVDQEFGLGAEVARHQTYAFYVGRGANNRPSLFQLRLQPLTATSAGFAPEELVEGIDSLQIRYGADADNDGDADSWAPADAVADWTRVLSLEVTLLARSADEYGAEIDTVVYNLAGTQFDPVDDRRFRQVFSTTVGVRNRLP